MEYLKRAINDLDVFSFIDFFFRPFVTPRDVALETEVTNFIAKELLTLKRGRELKERRQLVHHLMRDEALQSKIEKFLKLGYELQLTRRKRDEKIGNYRNYDNWKKVLITLIYMNKNKTKELIRMDYKILHLYLRLLNTAKCFSVDFSIVGEAKTRAWLIKQTRTYRNVQETVSNMENFGEAKLHVRYDYFDDVKGVSGIRFDPKEKKVKEALAWFFRKISAKEVSWYPNREEKFYAEALEFLVEKSSPFMDEILEYVKQLEFILGGVRFAEKAKKAGLPVIFPRIGNEKPLRLVIKNLYNPCLLLDFSLGSAVPNDVISLAEKRVTIITGKNNSGKSVYVKSIGLAYALFQNGFPITAEAAVLPELNGIFTHFVSPGDIAKGEGMFLDELRRIKELFLNASPNSLLIVDEPVRGSSFEDAEEITLRFIKGLSLLRAPTFLTTHLHRVASLVEGLEGIWNVQTELNKGKTTYRIVEGRAERSYGASFADEMGLTEEGILELIRRKD